MRSHFRLLLLLFLAAFSVNATHNRAGEITYTWLGGLTYEVVITTYTKETAPADRCDLTIEWGDNSTSVLKRENGPVGSCGSGVGMGVSLGNDAKKNVYRGQHTYQAPGFYTLAMQDPNRNAGISNIPNSVNIPFYISTILNVNPALGPNSSPVLLNPPLDEGCQNRLYIHNPGAWDPDGDSLSYSLTNCRGLNGAQITETYSPVLVQDSVEIDPITGDFVWDVPQSAGEFNFALVITEHRKGPNGFWQIIGQITRDMQVDIKQCGNNPPELLPLGPFCVLVGENLQFTVQATDPDGDPVKLTATGGPLEVAPKAQFQQPTNGIGSVQQVFSWTPGCVHVQKQPWYMYFKVEDNPPMVGETPLVDYLPVEITVIAPGPENPEAVPTGKAIDVSWDESICSNAIGYNIYRKEGYYGYTPDSCETGVPAYTGYQFLTSVNGLSTTSYRDSNDLKQGMRYCYMITAFFADEAESQASEEVCTELRKTNPILTNVDVLTTSTTTGSIDVKWVPARDVDSANIPPPYKYGLERAEGIDGSGFTEIATLSGLFDTVYTDNNLNTEDLAYRYRVGFYSGQNNVLVGYSDPASSVFLGIFPFDHENRLRFDFSVPWLNEQYIVYKETSPGSGVFDSLTTVSTPTYIDTGLVNGTVYCYKVEAIGRYTGSNLPEPLLNNSQIACAAPLDTIGPCTPEWVADANCEGGIIKFMWTNPTGEFCSNDIVGYNLYYKPTVDEPWPTVPLIGGIDAADREITITNESIVGCYVLTAYDDASPPNESKKSEEICVDGCPVIELPNVFSPNDMPPNNYFRPVRDQNGVPMFKDILQFDLQIFNRWGTLVFQTQDPDQFVEYGWDGKDMTTQADVAEGVYFYVFTYKTKSVTEQNEQVLSGDVTLFR